MCIKNMIMKTGGNSMMCIRQGLVNDFLLRVMVFVCMGAFSSPTSVYSQESKSQQYYDVDLREAAVLLMKTAREENDAWCVVLEYWKDGPTYLGFNVDTRSYEVIFDPDYKYIDIDTNGRSLEDVASQIEKGYESVDVIIDHDSNVIYVTDKLMMSNESWPLNQDLVESTALTGYEALKVLEEKYSMSSSGESLKHVNKKDKNGNFMSWHDLDLIVWNPVDQGTHQVRHLVGELLKRCGAENRLYSIKLKHNYPPQESMTNLNQSDYNNWRIISGPSYKMDIEKSKQRRKSMIDEILLNQKNRINSSLSKRRDGIFKEEK